MSGLSKALDELMKGLRISDRHPDGYLLADLATLVSLANKEWSDAFWYMSNVEAIGSNGPALMAYCKWIKPISTSHLLGLARHVTDVLRGEFCCEDPFIHTDLIILRFGSPDFVEVISWDDDFLALVRGAFREITEFEEIP